MSPVADGAPTEVAFTPGSHEPQTELEQCPSELLGNFYRIDKEVFLEKPVSGKEH
jgi:hypothetical protein